MCARTLTFQSINLTPVIEQGITYLTSSDLAKALGYKSADSVTKIYKRNSDEFSDGMTETVKLTASGNLTKSQRIFSLRGAHLIAMFARTKVAKEFRRWVLDVLDQEVNNHTGVETLTASECQTLRELVARKVDTLPTNDRQKAYGQVWARIQNKFRVNSYKQIPRTKIADAIEYIQSLVFRHAPSDRPISAEEKRMIEQSMANVTRHFSRHSQKAATRIHGLLRKRYGHPNLRGLTADRLPHLIADLESLEAPMRTMSEVVHQIERQMLELVEAGQTRGLVELAQTQEQSIRAIGAS